MFNVTDIPNNLRDNTLHVGVEWYALCIALRVFVGMCMIIFSSWLLEKGKWLLFVITGLMVFTVFVFLRKYFTVTPVWKVYMRYIIMSICIICLVGVGIWQNRDILISIAGIFVVIDVLMGVMSRYITMNMKYI